MSRDWGVLVPGGLPIEQIVELRDGLKSGQIKISIGETIERTAEIDSWMRELTEQMIAAYDRELQRRRS